MEKYFLPPDYYISNQLLWMPHNWAKSLVPKGKIHNRYLFGSHMHLSSYVIGNIIYRKEITKVVSLPPCHMIMAARFNDASSLLYKRLGSTRFVGTS